MAPIKSGPPRPDPELAGTLSVQQVALRWGIPRKKIRRMLGRQELGFVQISGDIRIPLAEVERFELRHRPVK